MLRPPFLHASSKCHCCWRILLSVVRMSWDVLGYPKVNAGNTTLLIHSYPYPQCQIPSTFRTPKCKPRFRLGFFMILGGSYLHTLYFYGKSTGKALYLEVKNSFLQIFPIHWWVPPLRRGMHQQFERSAQHVHLAYSSFCGASARHLRITTRKAVSFYWLIDFLWWGRFKFDIYFDPTPFLWKKTHYI